MKNLIRTAVLSLLLFTSANAQQAEDYFPPETGYRWTFRVVALDSINNEIDSLTYFVADSFAVVQVYQGENANLILSKSGTLNALPFLPYTDSTFLSFDGSTAKEYFSSGNFTDLILYLDSLLNDSTFSFLNFFNSLEDWYDRYRFASPVGEEYIILQKDTSVTYNTTELPIRFQEAAKRLDDETISTELGRFDCKKFVINRSISYILVIPPLPPIYIPIVSLDDTIWIAPDLWIVKEYIPSTTVDLSVIGIDPFSIPGYSAEVISPVTDLPDMIGPVGSYRLSQNYPNPFNPVTIINFSLPTEGFVSLEVFNLLGEKVTTIVDEKLSAGSYSVKFEAGDLPSGYYFYRLKTGSFTQTKKMVLIR
ncbi:MAG: hypothetical protein Kow0098_13800 [Ignavibacteriaceae bacterium]